jgi:hypothetical protein
MKNCCNISEMKSRAPRHVGANVLRPVLALALLIAMDASADAVSRQHVFIRRNIASSFAAAPDRFGEPLRPPTRHEGSPGYNDPSRFGGGEALPVR